MALDSTRKLYSVFFLELLGGEVLTFESGDYEARFGFIYFLCLSWQTTEGKSF